MLPTSPIVRSFVAAVAGCFIGASAAHAQCIYPHGQSTGANGWTRMAQAFIPCGGTDCDGFVGPSQNNSTGGGIPSCSPPQTYHQVAGSPPNGWRLATTNGRARFRLDGQPGPDVRIRVQLINIEEANGLGYAPIGPTGTVSLVFRITTNDAGTDMTVIDFPLSLPIQITSLTGDGLLDIQLNAVFLGLALPPLPPCSNVELIDLQVLDPNLTKFLRPGHFRL